MPCRGILPRSRVCRMHSAATNKCGKAVAPQLPLWCWYIWHRQLLLRELGSTETSKDAPLAVTPPGQRFTRALLPRGRRHALPPPPPAAAPPQRRQRPRGSDSSLRSGALHAHELT